MKKIELYKISGSSEDIVFSDGYKLEAPIEYTIVGSLISDLEVRRTIQITDFTRDGDPRKGAYFSTVITKIEGVAGGFFIIETRGSTFVAKIIDDEA